MVRLKTGNATQTGSLKGGGSYCSQSQLRLTFGLGKATRVDSIEVAWPSGKKQVLNDVPLNRIFTVHETQGLLTSE
jgi:hypothetical protein